MNDTTPATPTLSLDLDTARRLLNEAVSEKGADYVYEKHLRFGCSYLEYTDPGDCKHPVGPSCLIGNVLVKAGVPMGTLMDYEGVRAAFVLHYLGVTDEYLVQALHRAQRVQDDGGTWGQAQQEFEYYAALAGSLA